MKKIVASLVAFCMIMTFCSPITEAAGPQQEELMATSSINEYDHSLELSFNGDTEHLLVDGKEVSFYSYEENLSRFILVQEESGSTLVEVDTSSGTIYVNGKAISSRISSANSANILASEDNWGPEREEITETEIVGLSASVVAAIIIGYYSGWNGVAMDIAQTFVSNAIPIMYFKRITQFNYVDYFPKVGYRLTEELHNGPACDESTYVIGRTMTGSR